MEKERLKKPWYRAMLTNGTFVYFVLIVGFSIRSLTLSIFATIPCSVLLTFVCLEGMESIRMKEREKEKEVQYEKVGSIKSPFYKVTK